MTVVQYFFQIILFFLVHLVAFLAYVLVASLPYVLVAFLPHVCLHFCDISGCFFYVLLFPFLSDLPFRRTFVCFFGTHLVAF